MKGLPRGNHHYEREERCGIHVYYLLFIIYYCFDTRTGITGNEHRIYAVIDAVHELEQGPFLWISCTVYMAMYGRSMAMYGHSMCM